MKSQVVAKRYAKALFELALSEGKLEECMEELKALERLLDEVPEFEKVFKSPIYPEEVKRQTLATIKEQSEMSPLLFRFLELLIEKRRADYLRDIVHVYERLYDEHNNIVRAEVTAATDLDERVIEKIASSLKEMVGKTVIVEFRKDPELIGGVIAKVGDLVLDGSVRTQLRNIKETLKRGELG
ncbi:MAG: ATP synthase F1 subunit delta [Syntrophobacterales bacterium]|nr:ATP synthase F1 subunit delta [Syntrophobacterales bacterium]